jgi:hypothetical protein
MENSRPTGKIDLAKINKLFELVMKASDDRMRKRYYSFAKQYESVKAGAK